MIDGQRVRPWGDRYGSTALPDPDAIPDGVYGHWYDDPQGMWVVPDITSYSDYSGSLIERSNLEVFMEQFEDSADEEWRLVNGGHGTRALVIRVDADKRVPEIGEFFEGLKDYPLADEDHHSNLEQEVRSEQWKDWGRKDFRRWLAEDAEAHFEDPVWTHAVEKLTDDQIDELWWDHVRNGNGGEDEVEEGGNVFFDFVTFSNNHDVEEEVRRVYTNADWPRLFADFLGMLLWEKGFDVDGKRVEALPPDTQQALFTYFVDAYAKTDDVEALDFLQQEATLGAMIKSTPAKKWTQADWAIFLDVLEMEGPAAFEPGHAGRRFGRR